LDSETAEGSSEAAVKVVTKTPFSRPKLHHFMGADTISDNARERRLAGWKIARMARTAIVVALGLFLISSCRRSTPPRSELTVAAAADLESVFHEIAQDFETETSARVVLSFAASGNLKQQIENGAPFDVFASANAAYVDDLARQGLIFPDTRHIYAQGQITLWQRRDSAVQVNSLADLAKPEVKHVAIANPEHAPYGVAAVESLRSAGVYDAVEPKLVRGENIMEALQFVETGNADAGIVARSISERPTGRWIVIDSSLHQPLNQAICVIRSSRQEQLARRFLAYLGGAASQSVLKRYGFTIPADR
jgi:molybdate transport system substrate-binding protein